LLDADVMDDLAKVLLRISIKHQARHYCWSPEYGLL
jgi:hypothetical protein